MTTIEITSVLPDGPNAHGSVSVRLVDAGTGGAVGDEVIAGTQRVKLDVDGYGTIDLTPTADIDPPGTCWAFSVDGASPAVVRCITVPDSDTPVSWTDEAIQVGAPVPPDLFPLATSGDVGDVMTVVDEGNGKEWKAQPPTGGGGADHAVALFIESIEDSDTNAVFYGSGAVLPRSALAGLAVLVVSGTNFGLRTLTASGPLTAGATLAPGDIIVSKGQGYSAVASTADGTTVNAVTVGVLATELAAEAALREAADFDEATAREALTAADIGFAGSGVLAGAGTVEQGLNLMEGALNGQRDVSTVFLAAVPGLATLMSGPVADVNQPTGDDGRQVQKGDFVATLGDVDVDGNGWIHIVDIDTGQWGIVPSSGPSTPVGAGAWANALTTNYLRGGDTIVLASGAIGTYRVNRTSGGHTFTRGGPSRIADPYEEGEWVFTAPEGASGVTLGETSGTAYRGDRGKTAYDHSQVVTGNPHGTTAADLGLVIGTDVQAHSSTLDSVAGGGLLPNGEWKPPAVVCWQDWYNASTSPAATPTRAPNSGRYTAGYLDTANNSGHWIEFELGRLDAGTWSLRFFYDKLAANGEYTLSLGLAGGSLTALASLSGSTSTLNMYNSSTLSNEVVTITGIVIPTTGRQVLRATNTGTGGGSSYGGRWMLIKPIRTA